MNLDAPVFTAGIGENCPQIHAGIIERPGWLGVRLDAIRNTANERKFEASGSSIAVRMIPTDEQALMASATHAALAR